MHELTRILQSAAEGDSQAAEELLPLVYGELRRLAQAKMARADAPAAELVKLRYFAGLSMAESAAAMGLSQRAAERLWTFARAWLRHALEKD